MPDSNFVEEFLLMRLETSVRLDCLKDGHIHRQKLRVMITLV